MANFLAAAGKASDYIVSRIKAGAAPWYVREGTRAWAYYKCRPYPGAMEGGSCVEKWDVATDGPYPTCLPIARYVVDTSADFLFQEPPTLAVAASPELTDLLADIWRMNGVPGRLREEAVKAGNEGATVLKFAFTPDNARRPVAIQWLSPAEVTFFHDPLDADVLESVRVLFKYCGGDGKWYWYREEWDTNEYTVYGSEPANEYSDSLDLSFKPLAGYPAPNPFGLIPFVKIHNLKEAGETEGSGDLWNLWQLLDRINLQYWLWDRSSQLDGDPIWVALNAAGDVDPPSSGAVLKISGQGADFKAVESLGMQMPYRIQLIDQLNNWLIDTVSVVRLETDKITNKGNFTRAVLEQLHAPLIRLTNRKRTNWGENGLEVFAEALLEGLARHPDAVRRFPALSDVKPADPATFDVKVQWPGFFALSEDERSAGLANTATAEVNGYLTREMAVTRALGYFDGVDENTAKDEILAAYPVNPIVQASRDAAAVKAQAKAVTPGEPTAVPQ